LPIRDPTYWTGIGWVRVHNNLINKDAAMGMSIAKQETYYIYVLRLEGGRWYVGSTKSIERRMRSHFSRGGAIATRECCPISIETIYQLTDYQIRTDCAHERAEVIIAMQIALQHGPQNVRGAKHGKSWAENPSPNNLRDIERYRRFATTEEGRFLMASLKQVPICELFEEPVLQRFATLGQRRIADRRLSPLIPELV